MKPHRAQRWPVWKRNLHRHLDQMGSLKILNMKCKTCAGNNCKRCSPRGTTPTPTLLLAITPSSTITTGLHAFTTTALAVTSDMSFKPALLTFPSSVLNTTHIIRHLSRLPQTADVATTSSTPFQLQTFLQICLSGILQLLRTWSQYYSLYLYSSAQVMPADSSSPSRNHWLTSTPSLPFEGGHLDSFSWYSNWVCQYIFMLLAINVEHPIDPTRHLPPKINFLFC